MLCLVDVDCEDRTEAAKLICNLIDIAVVRARKERRAGKVRDLYSSGVKYIPQSPQACAFRTPVEVLKRKGGDCKQLVIWRIADLLEAGEAATPRILWVQFDAYGKPVQGFKAHAQLRRADGSIEDPSVILGMKAPRKASL